MDVLQHEVWMVYKYFRLLINKPFPQVFLILLEALSFPADPEKHKKNQALTLVKNDDWNLLN